MTIHILSDQMPNYICRETVTLHNLGGWLQKSTIYHNQLINSNQLHAHAHTHTHTHTHKFMVLIN